MAKVEIYTKNWCPYSARAKDQLDRKGVSYEEIDVTTDSIRELEMVKRSARHTVPQIFIDGYHLGGSDDLFEAEINGNLDQLLSGQTEGKAA
ncbi:MAG: glutaredoxin 3 [Candidatus Tectomicrobia bacterium]